MKNLFLLMLLFLSHLVVGQITVNGTISDENQEALIGATISIQGTGDGTTSDVDGKYSIRVPDGNVTLIFSYIGYSTREIALAGRSTLFSNESRAAKLLGIPQLKEETSNSVSAGITASIPDANLTLTIDGYLVNIDDRIVYTGQFKGPGTGTELDNLLSQANASAAAFFANAIDTKSSGEDVVITHNVNFGGGTKLKSSLAGTFSQTRQDGAIKASEVLENAGLIDTYFPEDSRVYLEEAVPRSKLV